MCQPYSYPWLVLALACALYALLRRFPRNAIPEHLLGHPVMFERELLSPEDAAELLRLVERTGLGKGFPTNVRAVARAMFINCDSKAARGGVPDVAGG